MLHPILVDFAPQACVVSMGSIKTKPDQEQLKKRFHVSECDILVHLKDWLLFTCCQLHPIIYLHQEIAQHDCFSIDDDDRFVPAQIVNLIEECFPLLHNSPTVVGPAEQKTSSFIPC